MIPALADAVYDPLALEVAEGAGRSPEPPPRAMAEQAIRYDQCGQVLAECVPRRVGAVVIPIPVVQPTTQHLQARAIDRGRMGH